MSPSSIQQGGGASGSGIAVGSMSINPAYAHRPKRRKKDPDMPRRNMYVGDVCVGRRNGGRNGDDVLAL